MILPFTANNEPKKCKRRAGKPAPLVNDLEPPAKKAKKAKKPIPTNRPPARPSAHSIAGPSTQSTWNVQNRSFYSSSGFWNVEEQQHSTNTAPTHRAKKRRTQEKKPNTPHTTELEPPTKKSKGATKSAV